MRQGEIAQRRWLQGAALPVVPITQLNSMRDALRKLALTGWHSLMMPLHQSRRREAERVLQRYRDLIIALARIETGASFDNDARCARQRPGAHNRAANQPKARKMTLHHGGCLCGAIRYATTATPLRVTVCHCKFCQRATGSAYMVEPIFARDAFEITSGATSTYIHVSEGSGKRVGIHFCVACGTKLFLEFERFIDIVGVYAGTFDDPNWFERSARTARHIFLNSAQRGTVIPAGFAAYRNHALQNDGTAASPVVFEQPHTVVGWTTDTPYQRTSSDPFDRPQPAWLASRPRVG